MDGAYCTQGVGFLHYDAHCTSVGVDQNAKRSQDAITWDRALPIGQLAQGLLTHVYALGACKSGAEHNSCHLSTSNSWQMA